MKTTLGVSSLWLALVPAIVTAAEPASGETTMGSSHQIFNVAGGREMDLLRCVTSQKQKSPERRPTSSRDNHQKHDSVPAGMEEEIMSLSEAEEAEMLKKALAPPRAEELRCNLPTSVWIKKFHAALSSASHDRIARVGIWGGSHMVAEFFTAELRQALQDRYGVGGAGHINLLYGRPGLNLPVRAFCRTGEWREELPPRMVGSTKMNAGLGLYTMTANKPHSSLEIDLRSTRATYRAQHVVVHFLRQPEGGTFELIVDGENLGTLDTEGPRAIGAVEVKAIMPLSRIELRVTEAKSVTLLGLFAEDHQGAVLDNFGIAGAAGNYWRSIEPELLRAAVSERPYDAVILAYGTNDVTGEHWNPERYRQDYRQTLIAIRAALPQAACILITPGDRATRFYVKKVVKVKAGKSKNVNKTQLTTHYDLQTFPQRHAQAAVIQRELGDEYQCTVWDMSLVMREMGGAYALMKRSPPWMSNDLIHLTPAGYREMSRRFVTWLELWSSKAH